MEPGLIWLLGGLLLLGAELALPGIFLFWVGLAAIGTGLVVLLAAPSFDSTIYLFLVLFAASILAAMRLRPVRRASGMNSPESGLVGRRGTLLPFDGVQLRVRLGDSEWPARLPRDVRVPEGAVPVRVEAVDGVTLVVRPE